MCDWLHDVNQGIREWIVVVAIVFPSRTFMWNDEIRWGKEKEKKAGVGEEEEQIQWISNDSCAAVRKKQE